MTRKMRGFTRARLGAIGLLIGVSALAWAPTTVAAGSTPGLRGTGRVTVVKPKTVSIAAILAEGRPSAPQKTLRLVHMPELDHHNLNLAGKSLPRVAAVGGAGSPASPVDSTPGGGGAQGFDGINITADEASGTGKYKNTNGGLEPPDQGLCVGNGYVIEAVNNSFEILTSRAVALTPPIPTTQFFAINPGGQSGPSSFVSDPRCLYDATTQRWFFMSLEIDEVSGISQLPFVRSHNLVAVSKTSIPTGDWYTYSFDVTDDGQNGTPLHTNCFLPPGSAGCLGDQPLLGADANGFYISTNEFPYGEVLPLPPPPAANGVVNQIFGLPDFHSSQAQLYAYSKSALESGQTVIPSQTWNTADVPLPAGAPSVAVWASIQPAAQPPGDATSLPALGAEYFLSSIDWDGSGANQIAVWSLTNTASLNTSSPSLALQHVLVNTLSGSYQYAPPDGSPFAADQRVGPTPLAQGCTPNPCDEERIAGNDDRMQAPMLTNGVLYSGLNTVLPPIDPQGSGQRADYRVGIQYYEVRPSLSGGTLSATMVKDGYINVNGNNALFPSLAATPGGQVVAGFSVSGINYFPSAAWARLDGLAPGQAPLVHISGAGVAPEDGFTGYPVQGIVSNPPAAQISDGVARWGDYSYSAVDEHGCAWSATEYIPNDPRDPGAADWGTFVTRVPLGSCSEPALVFTPFNVNGPAGTTCPGPQLMDTTGDAINSYNGGNGQTADNWDIESVAFSTPDPTHLGVTLKVKNMSPTPPPTNVTSAIYNVYWTSATKNYVVHGDISATGNAFSVNDGSTTTTIPGTETDGPDGGVSWTVPLNLVGNAKTGTPLTAVYADVHGAFSVAGQGTVFYTAAADRAPNTGFGANYFVGQVCAAGATPTFPVTASNSGTATPNTGAARALPLLPLLLLAGGLLACVALAIAGLWRRAGDGS